MSLEGALKTAAKSFGRFAVAASLALDTLGCAQARESSNVECRSAAIVGGTERAEYVALADSQARAIARLRIPGSAARAEASCTAVLVAPRVALTAAHCIPAGEVALELHFGSPGEALRVVGVAARDAALHSTLDLALLTWKSGDDVSDVSRPIPVDLGYTGNVGELVQIGGHGLTESGELQGLRFATESIVESSAEYFRVSANGRAGACAGDSGGPALSRDSDGSARLVGILSAGAAGCTDKDRYARLNGTGPWLAAYGVVPGPAEELANCEFVGFAGRCFGSSVLSCPDGRSARIERCEPGTQCGFDDAAGAFGCIAPVQDGCQGLGDLGACEGDDRLRCEDGAAVLAPCGACGASCVRSARDGRAICTR